jgi:hypothetical protein
MEGFDGAMTSQALAWALRVYPCSYGARNDPNY